MRMKNDVAVILLYDSKKRVLLQHRSMDAGRIPGYWAFFDGRIEKNETPERAVIREAIEELNYKLESPKLVMIQKFRYRKQNLTKYVFIEGYKPKKKLVLREGQGMKWYSLGTAKKLKMIKSDKEVLEYIAGKY